MLSKKVRATKVVLDRAFKEGRRVSSPAFDIVYMNVQTPYPLFGVSVTKKAAKNSVERHRIRRFYYDWFGLENIQKQVLCVAIVKVPLLKDRDENRRLLHNVLQRAGIV